MKKGLNCCYRLIWSDIQQAFIVVSELGKAHGKRASGLLLASGILASTAVAVPGSAFAATVDVNDGESVTDVVVDGALEVLNINSGGSSTSASAVNNGNINVNSGGTATGTSLDSLGKQEVAAGGRVYNTIVNSGGSQFIGTGGAGFNSIVNSGGREQVSAGGISDGAVVNNGGVLTGVGGAADNVARITNVTVNKGGVLALYTGNSVVDNAVIDGGKQIISNTLSGGRGSKRTANDSTVKNDGTQDIGYSGSANRAALSTGGTQNINGQGTANDTEVNDGGIQNVNSGGTANRTNVNDGGVQNVNSGGSSVTTTINKGGTQNVKAGGNANSGTVNSGGTQNVLDGATVTGTDATGGTQNVNSGGKAADTIVSNEGRQEVNSGGEATGTIVKNTGTQNVNDGGKATSGTVNSGGTQNVNNGGESTATTVNDGGTQNVNSGGKASTTTVSNGGKQEVNSGGEATDTEIDDGGVQSISNGGNASGSRIKNGGMLSVASGGTATDVNQESGGTLKASFDSNVSGINSNGAFFIDGIGKKANNMVLENGGQFTMDGKGSSTNTYLGKDGRLQAINGASATGITQSAGGALITDTDTDISGSRSGEAFNVDVSTHIANNLLLENGGTLFVLEDGFATKTIVNSGGVLDVARGGTLFGVNTLNDGATLKSNSTINNGELHFNTSTASNSFNGELTGSGSLYKEGSSTLTLSGTLAQAGGIFLQGGSLIMDGLNAVANITAQSGTLLHLQNNTTLTGFIDPTDMIIDKGSVWTMTGNSLLDNLNLAGTITFQPSAGSYVQKTLTVTNLKGNNGTIALNGDLPSKSIDRIIIDGGTATGTTAIRLLDQSGLGAKIDGEGIEMVSAINGATTASDAFRLDSVIQAGAFNYSLLKGVNDQNWYLSSREATGAERQNYRSAAFLYNSLYAQAMDYDSALLGSLDSRREATRDLTDVDNAFWGRFQAGQFQHRNGAKNLGDGNTPDSKGGYTFLQLGTDVWRAASDTMNWNSGVYLAAGTSNVNVQRDSGAKAGSVRDDVYSLGGYLTAIHQSGWWVDTVVQGSRHNMESNPLDSAKTKSDGWGYIGSIETGMPFSVGGDIVLEPQLQYQYRMLNLDNINDGFADVDFGNSRSQQVRAGVKIGNASTKQVRTEKSVPLNWWVRPAVVQTFGTKGTLDVKALVDDGGAASFSPNQDGTAVALDVGLDAQIRDNVNLGLRAGYTAPVKDAATGGYGGQLNLKVTF